MMNLVAKTIALLERFPLSILQFLFRFTIAAVFWHSGMTKIASWDTTIALFRDEYMVPILPPELAATLAATVELTCPVLLVLGVATRLATLPMLGMTFVIEVFVYPESWLEHLTWATTLLFILTRGPGAISLDHLIAKTLLRNWRPQRSHSLARVRHCAFGVGRCRHARAWKCACSRNLDSRLRSGHAAYRSSLALRGRGSGQQAEGSIRDDDPCPPRLSDRRMVRLFRTRRIRCRAASRRQAFQRFDQRPSRLSYDRRPRHGCAQPAPARLRCSAGEYRHRRTGP